MSNFLPPRRQKAFDTLMDCGLNIRNVLVKAISPDTLSREIFMEKMSECLERDQNAPLSNAMILDALTIIGATVCLNGILIDGNDEDADIVIDALKFSAFDKMAEHGLLPSDLN